MSPNSPKNGGDLAKFFTGVSIPWMLMTGTKDVAAVGDADVESRLAVFPGLPTGNKYQLVLDGGEHEAFSDHALPGSKNKRNPNHHRVILALSSSAISIDIVCKIYLAKVILSLLPARLSLAPYRIIQLIA